MAFLTAASPCALAIGTPAAVLCGIARAARDGVLVKGGAHLESLGAIRAVAFDKTGTLTTGELVVTDVVPLNGTSEIELMSLACAIESSSSHPLAVAIVNHAASLGTITLAAADVEQRAGLGAIGTIDGCRVAVGKRCLIDDDRKDETAARVDRLAAQGKAIVAVGRDGNVIGLLALADQPRANAKEVLSQLHSLSIRNTYMLTGDHELAAQSIAQRVGVDETFAGLLPEQKLQILQKLEHDRGAIAMVGDGVNDAPALAQATVGIAMGAAGTDVAIETADIVLMSSDLAKLPRAIALSRFCRKIIAQNLFIAIGVICVVAPLAALGFAKLSIAVLLHEGSTVVVVCNALRILGIQPFPVRSNA
jgi:Cd2+/Zn2+-exporting ATPase